MNTYRDRYNWLFVLGGAVVGVLLLVLINLFVSDGGTIREPIPAASETAVATDSVTPER